MISKYWSPPQLPHWPLWTARQKELWPSLRALFLRGKIAFLLFKTCRTKSIKTTLLFDTCVLEPGNKDNTRARSQWPWTELEGRKNHILQNIGNSCCVYLCFYLLIIFKGKPVPIKAAVENWMILFGKF